jgi:hypothetical protein
MADWRWSMMACMLVACTITDTRAAEENIGQIKTLTGEVYIARKKDYARELPGSRRNGKHPRLRMPRLKIFSSATSGIAPEQDGSAMGLPYEVAEIGLGHKLRGMMGRYTNLTDDHIRDAFQNCLRGVNTEKVAAFGRLERNV